MRKTVVINVVGLTPGLLGPALPQVAAWAARGKMAAVAGGDAGRDVQRAGDVPDRRVPGPARHRGERLVLPRGRRRSSSGGTNRLIQAPKIWEMARRPSTRRSPAPTSSGGTTCTRRWTTSRTRPTYPADGRKIPDIYTQPAGPRPSLQARAWGPSPVRVLGPRTSIRSSRWIADAAKHVEEKHNPTLTLVCLPHLDYNLQRLGRATRRSPKTSGEIDAVRGPDRLLRGTRAQVVVLSEYGITDVSTPVHPNRVLREHFLIAVREELGRGGCCGRRDEPGVYRGGIIGWRTSTSTTRARPSARETRNRRRAWSACWTQGERRVPPEPPALRDLVAIAKPDAWFTYYYWQDDGGRRTSPAPSISTASRTTRPSLFLDPALKFRRAKIGLAC